MSSYAKQTWINGPPGLTPLAAPRLNHMEDGIAAALDDSVTARVLVLNVGGTVPPGTLAGTVVIQKLS